eukprot:3777685-Rhodomonas_salina.1
MHRGLQIRLQCSKNGAEAPRNTVHRYNGRLRARRTSALKLKFGNEVTSRHSNMVSRTMLRSTSEDAVTKACREVLDSLPCIADSYAPSLSAFILIWRAHQY